MTSLIRHLRASIRTHADRTAVQGQGWMLSYHDLDRECGRLAARLRTAGVGPGHGVPLLMGRSPRFVIAMLAVLRCGAAYAPIDVASSPNRQAAVVSALASPLLLTDRRVDADVAGARRVIDVVDALAGTIEGDPPPWPDTRDGDPLYVMFTSGSTGSPKGVVIPHRGVARLVIGADYAEFRPHARWAQLSSVAFDASTLEIWGALLRGGCCVIQEDPMPAIDTLADFLLEQQITDAWLTASLFNSLVDERPDGLAGLHQLLTGGERLSPRHVRRCLELHPDLRLVNGYGPTENTTFSLCHPIGPEDVATGADIPIGRPIRGTTIAIVDAGGRELPPGSIGELLVGGAGVALGYLNDPELTTRRFVVRDGERWYRTGDRVKQRPDGVVEFHGRADRQVKLQGHRVELDEVERVVAACPGIGAAFVQVEGDTIDERHLVAFFVPTGEPEPSPNDVIAFVEQRLASPMVPRVLHAVRTLPRNLSGKVDRQALGGRPATPAPHPGAVGDAGPAGDTERVLRDIWRALLPAASLGSRTHFAEAGGTSILALRVAAEVRRRLGRDLAPIDVLRVPLLGEQARWIEGCPPAQTDGLATPGDADGAVRLSRTQCSLLHASRLDDSGCAMLVHTAWSLPDGFDLAGLQRAFERLADRHPVLRTAVALDGDRADARVRPALPDGWWQHQGRLDEWPSEVGWSDALLRRLNRPLDTTVAPMRVELWSAPDGRTLLVWTVHHFAIDEFSIGLALADLDAAMRGAGQPPVYGSAFALAVLEPVWTDGAKVRADAAALAQALAGQPSPLPSGSRHGQERPIALPAALSQRLFERTAQWHCTPLTPLVLACGIALQETFGDAWRFLLTPFSRRLEPELMEPVGCFIDLRLVEAGLRPGETPAGALGRVHGQLLAAQRPSMAPADRVADALDAIDPALRQALFQFALTWREEPERSFRLGCAMTRLMRVPQRGARFGLCLHLATAEGRLQATLEAVDEAWTRGAASRFGTAFVSALDRVLSLQGGPAWCVAAPAAVTGSGGGVVAAPLVDPQVQAEARRLWTDLLGAPPEGPQADFLRSGGSSILALRMASGLRRRCGLALDIGAFLAEPTFGALCRRLYPPRPSETPVSVLVGPRAYQGYVLLLPGQGGTKLAMYPLAEAIRHVVPPDVAVLIVDLASLVESAPHAGVRAYLMERLAQIVRDAGVDALQAVAGHSVGGLFGADLLHALGEPVVRRVPLVLLDTHTPQALRRDLAFRAELKLVRLARRPLQALRGVLPKQAEGGPPAAVGGAARPPVLAPQWQVLRREMIDSRWPLSPVAATLVKARRTQFSSGLLRWPESNGLDPAEFASLVVHTLDTTHNGLRAKDAARTARIVADVIRMRRVSADAA